MYQGISEKEKKRIERKGKKKKKKKKFRSEGDDRNSSGKGNLFLVGFFGKKGMDRGIYVEYVFSINFTGPQHNICGKVHNKTH